MKTALGVLVASLVVGGLSLTDAMRANLTALMALQPVLSSQTAFHDPANAALISKNVSVLAQTRHEFLRPKVQASAAAMAEIFSGAVARAQADLKAGRMDSARLRLRSLTSLCLGCHSRQLAHRELSGSLKVPKDLEPVEQAQFLAATRQFDSALAIWKVAITAPAATDAAAFNQNQALRSALSVVVRAKDDAAQTVALLTQYGERQDLPEYVRRANDTLLADAKAWQAEKLDAATASPRQLYTRATELISAAGAHETVFPRDTERVKLLRATAYLSLALEREPMAVFRGDALYQLGVATSALVDPELWELDGLYLEACIRENAHSALALRCMSRLSESTMFGYTGSGGTRLPDDVARHLETLRALARP